MFDEHGFDVVDLDGWAIDEQARLFGAAREVAGIHGAGLTNLIWCAPGSVRVIEIVPRTDDDDFHTYRGLSEALALPYRRIHGEFVDPAAGRNADYTVDLDAVVTALRSDGVKDQLVQRSCRSSSPLSINDRTVRRR